ncbi:hypothetical protein CDD80_2146 [Ophiocordyceps camponoti-rufipedis]|uniref:Uncharacterized protein n=1 Tax=Ophiocordyceps camponoti-rufipedis TaxID=2004952 RepID=A0A2C5Z1P0_9HYPO|nr:hypothetical protein CDD80_2146 [Ophiocordyceps camponoti-rufipedis]
MAGARLTSKSVTREEGFLSRHRVLELDLFTQPDAIPITTRRPCTTTSTVEEDPLNVSQQSPHNPSSIQPLSTQLHSFSPSAPARIAHLNGGHPISPGRGRPDRRVMLLAMRRLPPLRVPTLTRAIRPGNSRQCRVCP